VIIRRDQRVLVRVRRSPVATSVVALAFLFASCAGLAMSSPGIAVAAGSTPVLMPAAGQFVSTPVVRVLDTRYGTGGVPVAPMSAGATLTFPVAGVFGIPASASAVVLDVTALNPTATGYLSAYDADTADPGVASVGVRQGHMTNQTTTAEVSSEDTVSLTNHSSGSSDITASIVGYYTEGSAAAAGDTYFGVPWSEIGGTVNIAAGGNYTFQISGQGGIATGADTAVLQVNAINATASGYLDIYPAGTSDPNVSALGYNSDTFYRDVEYAPLSSSGQITISNHGTESVGVTIWPRGYFMPPSTTPAGAEYWPLYPQAVFGTATAGTQLAANASATFQVTGTGNIPASGVAEVSEDVVATNPTSIGNIAEGPADGTARPIVSYLNADSAYAGYDDGLVSTLSPSGEETITNNGSGTVDVQVAVTGWFQAAGVPAAPMTVTAAGTATSATIAWTSPAGDGGSPITGYTVMASPDNASVSVGPGASGATITGLSDPSADTYSVTAVNAVGDSASGQFGPATQVLSGSVLAPAPAGQPNAGVPDDQVLVYDSPPAESTTQTLIGTTTTDSSGDWTFTVPAYSALPAAVQGEAAANGGILNFEIDAYAMAAGYLETATTFEPAWVGSSTTSAPPAALAAPATESMVLTPPGPDNSSQNTGNAESLTWASQNDPGVTGGPADPGAAPPLDSYGYQAVGSDDNYNPNITYDGTDLTNVTPQPYILSANCSPTEKLVYTGDNWTTIGEVHTSANSYGSFTYSNGSSTTIDTEFSSDGDHVTVDGKKAWTYSNNSTPTWGTIGPNDSRRAQMLEDYYVDEKTYPACNGYAEHHKWWTIPDGLHKGTGPETHYGSSGYLNGTDTEGNYCDFRADHPGWVYQFAANTGDIWSSEKGYSYGIAAAVDGFGVGDETDYSTVTTLTYSAGTKTRYRHWTWGDTGNPYWGGPNSGDCPAFSGHSCGGFPEIVHALDWDPSRQGTLCGYS
jgi:fibronectin type III domain protein